MSGIDDGAAEPLGRRSLLKKGAAAGAIGLTAPLTIQSFFSPAAATSHDDPPPPPPGPPYTIARTVHFGAGGENAGASDWRMSTNGLSAVVTPSSVTPAAGGGLMLVIFSFLWNDSGQVGTGTGADSPPATPSLTDTLGTTYTNLALQQFRSTAGGNGAWMAAYSAPITSTTARTITVSFTDSVAGALDDSLDVDNFVGQVVQLAPDDGETLTVTVTDTAVATADPYGSGIGVALPAAAGDRAQLVVFSSVGTIQTGAGNLASWPAISSVAGFAELADSFSNDTDATDLSLQTSFNPTATAATVSSSQTTDAARLAPDAAGALAIGISY